MAEPLLPERQHLEVGREGGDDLLRHLVDAGQAEAGLDEGGIGSEPILYGGDRAEEWPPPPRKGLPLVRCDLGGGGGESLAQGVEQSDHEICGVQGGELAIHLFDYGIGLVGASCLLHVYN